jgi:hypothetical protein
MAAIFFVKRRFLKAWGLSPPLSAVAPSRLTDCLLEKLLHNPRTSESLRLHSSCTHRFQRLHRIRCVRTHRLHVDIHRRSDVRGKRLWGYGRAADMVTFQFGSRTKKQSLLNKDVEVGEFALHIQCAWRIRTGNRTTVGRQDLYYPEDLIDERQEIPADFDWDQQPNRCGRLLRSFFKDGKRELVVKRVEHGAAGSLCIELEQESFLEVFPDNSLPGEYWRLFNPGNDHSHVVMTGAGALP